MQGVSTGGVAPGPDSADVDDVETMLSAARVFAAITAESLAQAEEDVTLPQLRVLVLTSLGGTVTPTHVAEALDVHLSSASRICERLVQAGYLDRHASPGDRRQVELALTASAQHLLAKVVSHRRQVFRRLLAGVGTEERRQLVEAMATLVEAAEEYDRRRSLLP
jgi:DNA-binding MarR family transcriptional regulator